VSYSPPAQNQGVDVTVTTQPGVSLSGCTDHTGSGITGGSVSAELLFPALQCGVHAAGVVWGTGTGRVDWSDGATSTWSVSVVGDGTAGGLVLEFSFTGGLWTGATASIPMLTTSSDGNCTTVPVTTAMFASTGAFVLHPAGTTTRPPLQGAFRIAAGGYHSCAVVAGGSVKCWGQNGSGELGNGTTATGIDGYGLKVPVDVVGIIGATDVDAGGSFTCALLSTGAVKCWGSNGFGQLGNGTNTDSNVPVDVVGVSGATAITTGIQHACAVVAGGAVKCWGKNNYGQLGDGTTTDSNTAVNVTGLTGAAALSAGFHTCAIVAVGSVKCWGRNGDGELGNGTQAGSATPVDVIGVTGATTISAREYHHTCAVTAGGAAKCWGSNYFGELSNGTTSNTSTPLDVIGVGGMSAIGLGYGHMCAVVAGGAVKCTGDNYYGQLGNGTNTNSSTPVDVTAVTGATAVVAGYNHSCALVAGGRVNCWGFNTSGQLGNGTTTGTNTPVDVIANF
jgi:alpha-tubulin suppressor-like RCC1 family protein